MRVGGQEPLEVPVPGVEEAELAGTDALPEPLGWETPPPPEGVGTVADPEGAIPPPPAGEVAGQLQSVTVTVLTTVTGEPERGDSEGCGVPPPPAAGGVADSEGWGLAPPPEAGGVADSEGCGLAPPPGAGGVADSEGCGLAPPPGGVEADGLGPAPSLGPLGAGPVVAGVDPGTGMDETGAEGVDGTDDEPPGLGPELEQVSVFNSTFTQPVTSA